MGNRVRTWIHELLRRPPQPTTSTGLHPTENGLEISPLLGKPSSMFVSWSDVLKAVTFKRDQYVVDRICLVFELSGDRAIEINEDMLGWQEVVERLPEYLPGTAPFHEWFQEVAFPAFATNARTIFEHGAV